MLELSDCQWLDELEGFDHFFVQRHIVRQFQEHLGDEPSVDRLAQTREVACPEGVNAGRLEFNIGPLGGTFGRLVKHLGRCPERRLTRPVNLLGLRILLVSNMSLDRGGDLAWLVLVCLPEIHIHLLILNQVGRGGLLFLVNSFDRKVPDLLGVAGILVGHRGSQDLRRQLIEFASTDIQALQGDVKSGFQGRPLDGGKLGVPGE